MSLSVVSAGKLPVVSVVIPCHNAAEYLAETLQSVKDQRGVATEVIVVDDGSTDGSADVAERFGHPVTRIIRQTQAGVSRARNVGTAAATAPFIVFLDADDVLMPGTLASRATLAEASDGDVIYTDWTPWERDGAGAFVEGAARRRVLSRRPETEIVFDAWWPPGALLYRSSVTERLLPWREDLPVIQDARFLLDAALAGARFVHDPHVGLRYRIHGSGSLSRRDPRAFLEDCFRSISDVDASWTRTQGMDEERRKALLKCYAFLTRSFYTVDAERHAQSLHRLLELDPQYIPDGPADFRVLARLVGFARAERIAEWCRPLKHAVPRLLGRAS